MGLLAMNDIIVGWRRRAHAAAAARVARHGAVALLAIAGLSGGPWLAPPASAAEPSGSAILTSNPADILRARHAALKDALQRSPFKRPLFLDSKESSRAVRGDVYAVVAYPFAKVGEALQDPAHWCDILILHPNTKSCQAVPDGANPILKMGVGKKFDQPASDAYQIALAYKMESSTPDYLQVRLDAKNGPLGTSDYRIMLEAVSLPGGRSFLHMSYSYVNGMAGNLATKAYLATAGRNKVGFSTVGSGGAAGQPEYIGGVRGMVERNAMRYYLAIEAFLSTMTAPPAEQFDKRLQSWFSATEQYSRQLHDMDRGAYLEAKRNEVRR